ncbi:MAG: hypothetical protein Q9192_005784 [Flavoplaca navasiana]
MLPDFLDGSYKRYKQDTALFTTRLAKAASSVGYNPNSTKQRRIQQPELVAAEPQLPQSALPKGPRLKGKARKAAKNAAESPKEPNVETSKPPILPTVKYTITTAELLRQATPVAESYVNSGVSMPASLRTVVERAVRARQRCSDWF